jgi:hypothetical protein
LGSVVSWEWFQRHRRHRQPIAPEDASSRITAYVYGNILIMAALIALDSQDLLGPKAAGYVVGTGVSTFLAHVVAALAGSDLGTDRRMTLSDVRHAARDSAPILSAMTLPTLLVVAALWGWLDQDWALGLAAGVTIVRIASLGWVVGHFKDRRASLRSIAAGIGLAGISAAAALVKFWLTH